MDMENHREYGYCGTIHNVSDFDVALGWMSRQTRITDIFGKESLKIGLRYDDYGAKFPHWDTVYFVGFEGAKKIDFQVCITNYLLCVVPLQPTSQSEPKPKGFIFDVSS